MSSSSSSPSSSSSSSSSSPGSSSSSSTVAPNDGSNYKIVGPPAYGCIGGTGTANNQSIKPVPIQDDSGSGSGQDQKSSSLLTHTFSFIPKKNTVTLKVKTIQSSELQACRADINTFLLKYGVNCGKELLQKMKGITDSIFNREKNINIDLNLSVFLTGLSGANLSRYISDVNTYIGAWTTRLVTVCDIYYSISNENKESIYCLGYKIRNLLAPNQKKITDALNNKYKHYI